MSEARSSGPVLKHRYADLGGVKLHCVEAGEGPLVILLHGFPEFWYSWRFQIPALADAGFRVVAPDMRGYNLSDRPLGAKNYRTGVVAWDVERLIRECGEEKAFVVGHDWGAAVAWAVAMHAPGMVERLAILNVPHPDRFLRGLGTLRQLRKSWYMFALQVPGPPGRLIERKVFEWAVSSFRSDPARPGTFSEEDIRAYEAAMDRPGALTAATNYYRAAFRSSPARTREQLQKIEVPVLVIWGERDRFLGAELAEPDHAWVPNVRVERLPDASHWVQVDQPDRVNALLLDFLQEDAERNGAGDAAR